MNRIKHLLVIIFCLILILNITPLTENYEIKPYNHYQENIEKK